MRKWLRLTFSVLLVLIAVPVLYLLVALLLSYIPVNSNVADIQNEHTVYLSTNGVHLDIIIPVNKIDQNLLRDLVHGSADNYLAFGWGDKSFYLEAPSWDDLKVMTVLNAMLIKSETLMHVTRHQNVRDSWATISVSSEQLNRLNALIYDRFYRDDVKGAIQHLDKAGYGPRDDFYLANGSYHCFNTCNSWVNEVLKQIEVQATVWTPFDFPLMQKHKK